MVIKVRDFELKQIADTNYYTFPDSETLVIIGGRALQSVQNTTVMSLRLTIP